MEHSLFSINKIFDKILKSVQNAYSEDLIFDNLFSSFISIFNTEIVLVDSRGNIFKKSKCEEINSLRFDFKKILISGFDEELNKISDLRYSEYFIPNYFGFIMPILFANRYLGLLFIYSKEKLSNECVVCLKSISMFISAVIFENEKDFERKKSQNKEIVKSAFGTLSYSEFEAIVGIFSELKGTEGILIMKQIAENLNITRSVIVNAIKKFESANIIESRSLGMKGTYIKILNKSFIDEIEKIKK